MRNVKFLICLARPAFVVTVIDTLTLVFVSVSESGQGVPRDLTPSSTKASPREFLLYNILLFWPASSCNGYIVPTLAKIFGISACFTWMQMLSPDALTTR